MVLPFERLAAHRAHVFPLVAVRQFVLRERRCVVEHLPADLQQRETIFVKAAMLMKITHGVCQIAATSNYITPATEYISLDYHGVAETSLYTHPTQSFFFVKYISDA